MARWQDGILALLDTGFNGALFMNEDDARHLGLKLRDGYSTIELAGRSMQQIRRGLATIIWLGEVRQVEVIAAISGATQRSRRADDPAALIGTELLDPHLLLMDFKARTIEIEAQE